MTEENRFEAIKKAVEQRDAFLAENPEYQWLQNDINELLGKAGSQHNRNAILAQMMRQKFTNFHHLSHLKVNL